MRTKKTIIMKLRWAYKSEGTFSDVATIFFFEWIMDTFLLTDKYNIDLFFIP